MKTIKCASVDSLTTFACAALLLALCLLHPAAAKAQWTNPDGNGNINNTNTGKVGVGTSSPGSKLDVNGRIQQTGSTTDAGYLLTNGGLLADTTGLNPGIAFYGGNGVNALYGADMGYNSTTSRYRTRLFSGNILADVAFGRQQNVQSNPTQSAFIEFLTVRGDTGNVGVGTANPADRLAVAVDDAVTNGITQGFSVGHTTSGTPAAGMGSSFGFRAKRSDGALAQLGYIGAVWEDPTNGAEDGALVFAPVLNSSGFGTERMRIASWGGVGIGTSTPTGLLSLKVAAGDVIQAFNNAGGSGGELHIRYKYESASHRLGLTDSFGNWLFYSQYASPSSNSVGYFPGKLGIGNSSPIYSLDVNGGTNSFRAKAATVSSGDAIATFENSSGVQMIVRGNGFLGVGTTSPAYKLHVEGGLINASGGLCINADCKTSWSQVGGSSQWSNGTGSINYTAGNVGIGTSTPTKTLDVVGDLHASGTITGGTIVAKYQDVAEWVESPQELAAGTVVVLDTSKSNQVVAATRAYDTRVAGVISLKPGITLGEQREGRVLVATTGRVKVRVDATHGPIRIGDLLVTSGRDGFAMKSRPVNVGGMRIHRPGTLIGKALEPLEKGTGEILVLLSLQ